jgi:hypothetical protein
MKYWLIGITAALSLMALAPDRGNSTQPASVTTPAR